MIKIGTVGMINYEIVDVDGISPDDIFIVTGTKIPHPNDDIEEIMYYIKDTETGMRHTLFEKYIVVLYEP